MDQLRQVESQRRLRRQAQQSFNRGLSGRSVVPTPLGSVVYTGPGAGTVRSGSRPAGERIWLSATGDSIASAGDYIVWDTIEAQTGFDTMSSASATVTIPAERLYTAHLWVEWDSYLYGGTVELEVNGTVVWTWPGVTTLGQHFADHLTWPLAAGDTVKVKVTQSSGSAQTVDAHLILSAVEPIRNRVSSPPPATALTPTSGGSGTDVTVDLPTGVAAGDVLVMAATSLGPSTITGMSGWTKVWERSSASSESIWVKIADAADAAGATYLVTIPEYGGWSCHALVSDGPSLDTGSLVSATDQCLPADGNVQFSTSALPSGEWGLVVGTSLKDTAVGSRTSHIEVDGNATELSAWDYGHGCMSVGTVPAGHVPSATFNAGGLSTGIEAYAVLLAIPTS